MALYRSFLRLPAFKGKPMMDRLLKAAWYAPRPSRLANGLAMWLDPMEWTQAELLAKGVIEPLTTALMRRLLGDGATYVDVGAHVGFHTLTARQCVGAGGRVVAVEPQPYNCERILHNWQLNGFENLDLFVAAAGARSGMVALRQQAATDKARLSLALEGVNDQPQRYHVAMVAVDDVVRDLGIERIDLVKIDVEGYESQVIEGMRNTLARASHLVFEMLPAGAGGAAGRELLEGLRAAGFDARTVTGEWLSGLDAIQENNVWCTRWSDDQVKAMMAGAHP